MSTILRGLFKKKVQQFTIAIAGLDRAGKTTIVNRLMKQTHIETVRTMGVDCRKVKYRNLEFGIFDLGGQKTFREFIWDEYLRMAQGIVYVLDAADDRLAEAAEAFWNTMSTVLEEETQKKKDLAPVLFLANKNDLPNARSFDQIIDDLNLGRATRTNRPFGLFRISAKTGENFYDAWDWLSSTLSGPHANWSVSIRGIILIDLRDRNAISQTSFGPIDKESTGVFMDSIEAIAEHLAPYPVGMDVTFSKDMHLVTVKRQPYVCAIIEDMDDPVVRARLISERIMKTMYGREPGDIFSSEELQAFIQRTYPLDLYKLTPSKK